MDLLYRLVGAHIAGGTGDRIAYLDSELGPVSYAKLHRAVRRYAGVLQQRGVRPGTRGLVVADDSVATVVAILGLWANRCVPVPVSPLLADSELSFIAGDCAARFVHLDRRAIAGLSPDIPLWSGDRTRELVVSGDGYDEASLASWSTSEEVLIQYTSGSTGIPKGVRHGLAGIDAVLGGFGHTLGLAPDDTVLSTAKLSFGYGFGNSLLFPLAAGARAILLRGPVDAHRVAATIADHRPTVLFSVPRMYHGLVELAARGGTRSWQALAGADSDKLHRRGTVRLAVSAGEHLPADLHQRFEDGFGVPLINGLGATEVLHIVVATRPLRTEKGATGRAVPDVTATIRDADGDEVYNGTEGRLHIAGPTVALGYHDRPEQTARTFADGGAYTGDVVRRGGAGDIWYVCRADDLLNLGGFRVSPLEIEAVVRATPGVADCAVVGHTDAAGLQQAVTYVVPVAGADRTLLRKAVLRAFRDHLAPFKRPSRVEVLDALPTTSTGKLARFKLRNAPVASVVRSVLSPGGSRTLVCIPFAGGSTHAYSRLVRGLGPTWRVVTGEAGYRPGATVSDAAEAWWSAVGADLSPGSVLFGHSAGAAVVAEIAHRYGEHLAGVHVVVSAPPLRLPDPLLVAAAEGDEDALLDHLAATALLPSGTVGRDELKRLVLPGFVSDLQLLRDGWKPETPAVPVHLLVGSDDPNCRPRDVDDRLAGWPLAGLHVVEGGHYFCVDNPTQTAALLTQVAVSS